MPAHVNVSSRLLAQLQGIGIAVERLENDSRRVREGDVFIASPGAHVDGRSYIADAIRRGAAAVLWEHEGYRWNPDRLVPNLPVYHLDEVVGHLAHEVYARPSQQLRLIGVTGTNGKTSCTHWIAQALAAAGAPCAVVGTLGNGFPGALIGSANTTPDALALHAALRQYADAGAAACAMEVSSIGLAQSRCNGACFETAVFTNLTRDHLDFHGTMEAYAAEKCKLFVWPELRTAVLNLDDPFGRTLAGMTTAPRIIGYSIDHTVDARCTEILAARRIEHAVAGLRFELVRGGETVDISAPLVGRYNVANLLAVAATLLAGGLPFAALPELLGRVQPPPGRMQRYGGHDSPLVVVDYAHSPDALMAALDALRPAATARGGKLVCVFGCGGDRDRGKRPQMGEIATRLADRVWLTSDNPRSEQAAAIVDEIRAGAGSAARVELDRAQAIAAAIAEAGDADVVLVAGKGHETYQEIAGERRPFSDAAEVNAALQNRIAGGRR
jgi:UDP-N-acetylmuramoyl-L-alanyl-D-glutamate--2,6-diaminopimelate ligase